MIEEIGKAKSGVQCLPILVECADSELSSLPNGKVETPLNGKPGPETQNYIQDDMKEDDIAIIGMSLRLPNSATASEYWSTMANGTDAVIPLPKSRWTKQQSCHPTKEQLQTEAGFLSVPVDEFDAKFFNISPMELSYMDPQQRFLLEVTWEAVEDAGLSSDELVNGKVGCFTGSWTQEYRDLMLASGCRQQEFVRTYMGNSIGATSAKISHFLKLSGPNMATESGCSSSIMAVINACNSLKNRDCDAALACGVNLLLKPYSFHDTKGLLSPRQRCRAFDISGDGFVRSEGCVVMVLKRLSSALKNKDKILGVIRGYAYSQEGSSRSIGTPSVKGEAAAMIKALEKSGVNAENIQYIEAHGTGTGMGDPTEVEAIKTVYSTSKRENPLVIGSVKANIGHTESCCGLASIAKVLLMFDNEIIPPNINLKEINPQLPLAQIPARIPVTQIPWSHSLENPRIAAVHSFGISGTYGSLIIQEPPNRLEVSDDLITGLPSNLVCISAKTPASFQRLQKAFLKCIESNPALELEDIAFTANACRHHFPLRMFLPCTSSADLLQKLRKDVVVPPLVNGKRKICFLYSGIGISYYSEMGKEFYKYSPIFASEFDKCSAVVKNVAGLVLKDLVLGDIETADIVVSHTVTFVMQYCLTKLLLSIGIHPSYVLGLSFGEYLAAVFAGLISLEDGVRLTVGMARCIGKSHSGSLAVINCSEPEAAKLIEHYLVGRDDEWIDIAAVTSSSRVTISSRSDTLEKFIFFIRTKEGIDSVIINYPHSLHSRSLCQILQDMMKEGKKAVPLPVKAEGPLFISSSKGEALYFADAKFWAGIPQKTVQFQNAKKYFGENDVPLFVEVGPSSILLQQEMETSGIPLMPNKPGKEWEHFVEGLGRLYVEGIDINWRAFYSSVKRKKVSLPFYQFDRSCYWFPIQNSLKGYNPESNSTVSHLLSTAKATPDDTFVCESFLEKSNKDLEYLSDHKILGRQVFPGSGFLELVLSTVKESGANFHLTVSNFQIVSPLDWQGSELHKFYVSYSKANSNVRVYHSCKSSGKWELKANAGIEEEGRVSSFDSIPAINLKKISNKFVAVERLGLYEKLNNAGYTFGNSFKSIESVYKGQNFVVCKLKIPSFEENSCLHPLVGDAMLQTVLVLRLEDNLLFQLPSAIFEISILNSIKGKCLYTYCSEKEGDKVFLFNEEEELLVKMGGIDFVKSSPEKLLNAFDQDANTPVPILVESWVKSGQLCPTSALNSINFADAVQHPFDAEKATKLKQYNRLDKAIGLRLLKVFISLGIMNLKSSNTLTEIMTQLNISQAYRHLFPRLLEILEEDGFVYVENSVLAGKKYTFRPELLPPVGLNENLSSQFEENGEFCFRPEWKIASLTLEKAEQILQGNISPLTILFPECSNSYSAEKFYYNSKITSSARDFLKQIVKRAVLPVWSNGDRDSCISVCEVGAGTGSTTSDVLQILRESGLPFTYTFTDISPSFFPKAKEKFGTGKEMFYKTLDLEKDVLDQGFLPLSYDIVIGANVLHATRNLVSSCSNIFKVLKQGGIIIGLELFDKIRTTDVTFGMLEGFWRFSDFEFRPEHCLASTNVWKKVLLQSGFEDIAFYNDAVVNCGIFVGKSSRNSANSCKPCKKEWICVGRPVSRLRESIVKELMLLDIIVLELDQGESDKIRMDAIIEKGIAGVILLLDESSLAQCDPLDISCQVLDWFRNLIFLLKGRGITVVLVSRGAAATSPNDAVNTNGLLLLGMARTLQVECPLLKVKVLDLDINSGDLASDTSAVIREMYNMEQSLVSIRNSQIYSQELNMFKPLRNVNPVFQGERYHLSLPKSRLISDVEIVPSPLNSAEILDNYVEIGVKAHGLNFREIFSILKPSVDFENVQETVGLDVAGVVTRSGNHVSKFKVGDRVFGFVRDGLPLSSHTLIPESDVLHIPSGMPFDTAATFPVAFVTAHHAIVEVAKVQAGETVLVHTASGAVGLMCLQICKKIGAVVIATAGSNKKRSFLRSYGINFVANSRTLEFKEEVSKATKGGVDVVINTLTGPGFKEASLDSCKIGGRFIELSKLNIWTEKEVRSIRPDVGYFAIDLSQNVSVRAPNMLALETYIQNGWLSPIPHTQFDISEIARALYYLERASHIGKVVCVAGVDHPLSQRPLFVKEATYLVTGGTRGVGLATAGWLLEQGARNILLCSRSPPSHEAVKLISSWKKQGNNVFTTQADVSLKRECERILAFINMQESLPPLRGIFHAAGCLLDNPISKQDRNSFLTVFKPKIYGALNLHNICIEANFQLDYFVVFSSFGGVLGSPGQCNHVIANNYMDSLIHKRNSIGLSGTSVQWGHWNETGIVAGKAVYGIKPMTNKQAFQAFETILRNRITKSAAVIYDGTILFSLFPWLSQILPKKETICENEKSAVAQSEKTDESSEKYKKELENAKTKEEIRNIVYNIVKENFYLILHLPVNKQLTLGNELIDYGLDSLMAIELRNRVQHQIGNMVQILTNFFTESQSIKEATDKIVDAIEFD